MKKLLIALALCMIFALGVTAYAEDAPLDHANCGVEGTDWELALDPKDYKPATCEEDGYLKKHCSICGEYQVNEVLPALGHNYVVDAAVDPTCEETGLTEGESCHNEIVDADGNVIDVCGDVTVAQEEVPALGHKPEAKDPNWKENALAAVKLAENGCEGFEYSTEAWCPVCEQDLLEKIVITFEHEPEVVEAVSATCYSTGLTEGSWCPVCEHTLVEQEETEMLPHTWKFVAATAGSCTEDAVSYHEECSVCGEKNGDYVVLPAPGHKEVEIPAVAPTCTETGLTAGKECTVCGEVTVKQEEVAALGHVWETQLGVAATCEEAGVAAHRKCTRCGIVEFNGEEFEGEKAEEAVIIPAHGHADEDGWQIIPNAGKPAEPREADPSLLVKTNPDDEKAATCETDGYVSALHCPWCGEERVAEEILPATGHDWKIIETGVVPTCTETGISDLWECQNDHCNLENRQKGGEIIAPLGHDLVTVDAVLATCETDGHYEYAYCDRVGCTYAEVTELDVGIMANIGEISVEKDEDNNVVAHPAEVIVPAFNHGYEPGVEVYEPGVSSVVEPIAPVAPTCNSTGRDEGGLYCTLCDTVIVPAKVLDKIPHEWEIVDAVAATCTTDGNLKFKYCTNEGCTLGYILDEDDVEGMKLVVTKNEENVMESYPAEVVLAKFNHNDPKPGTAVAPTCTEAGWTEGLYCGICGITLEEQEEIPATGHTEEVLEAVAPTCTETGLTEGKKCSVCDEILVAQKVVDALGHTYDQYTPAVAPTCTKVGYTEGLRCSVCEPDYGSNDGWLIYPQEIPMVDHEMAYETNLNQDATCEEEGYENYNYCVNCDYTEGKILPALGHDWMVFDEEAPTCTEYGVIVARTCRTCGITQEQVKVEPLGHDIVVIEGKEPTCTETGLTDGEKCDRCGLVFVEQEEIPATGHDMSIHIEAVEPTCTTVGNKEGQKCANCDHQIGGEEIPMVDHVLSDWIVEIEPTYGDKGQGLRVKICEVCRHKIESEMIPSLGEGELTLGDANDDGDVNIIDVLVILQYDEGIIGDEDINFVQADFNEDGNVNVIDAMLVLYVV